MAGWKVISCKDGDRIVLAPDDGGDEVIIEIAMRRNYIAASINAPLEIGINHVPKPQPRGIPRSK